LQNVLIKIVLSLFLVSSLYSCKSKSNLTDVSAKISGIEDRVHLIGSLPAPHHLRIIQNVDLGIGLYRPISLNQIYAAPNRLHEFSNFGIPLILPAFPTFKSLAIKYPFAINTVDPEVPQSIANVLTELLNEANSKQGVKNAFKFKQENGDYTLFAKQVWEEILNTKEYNT
jgi:hypothetical protein